ncbi:hypothetical protein [Acinetobacter indicus]|uniref:hypothetical protein n=1 Tax=Acinetobacter indicus TaxID=756892 RepID=UPI0014446A71|nr:hypothetical protein [Acinetobacter indicus]
MKFYERVISDFGGYEKCKDILSQPNIDFIMNAQGLREHMLEYRREHNIFEENDKIVFVDNFMHGELMTVAWTRKGEVWMDEGAKRRTDLTMIRHATDDEIKAGKRLEVNHD